MEFSNCVQLNVHVDGALGVLCNNGKESSASAKYGVKWQMVGLSVSLVSVFANL